MYLIRYNIIMIEIEKTDIYQKWLENLRDRRAKIIITARIKRLQMGNFGDCKFINKKIYELRINYAKGYRVYFINKNNKIILLLLGGDKSTQTKDIQKAIDMAEELVLI